MRKCDVERLLEAAEKVVEGVDDLLYGTIPGWLTIEVEQLRDRVNDIRVTEAIAERCEDYAKRVGEGNP